MADGRWENTSRGLKRHEITAHIAMQFFRHLSSDIRHPVSDSRLPLEFISAIHPGRRTGTRQRPVAAKLELCDRGSV